MGPNGGPAAAMPAGIFVFSFVVCVIFSMVFFMVFNLPAAFDIIDCAVFQQFRISKN